MKRFPEMRTKEEQRPDPRWRSNVLLFYPTSQPRSKKEQKLEIIIQKQIKQILERTEEEK